METTAPATNGAHRTRRPTPYEEATLGFRNYWWPACLTKDVSVRKPKAMRLLGDEVVFFKRSGHIYALRDECPHRGTRLSRGKYEFPGTDTISCRYHGWTYDVKDGMCLADLTDGPDSPARGRVRVKSYPVQEAKGIVWIWMGEMEPVPLEEDVPPLVLREDTWLNTRATVNYGNWRWHFENPGGGHAFMVHRDSIHMLFTQLPAFAHDQRAALDEEGEDGVWMLHRGKGVTRYAEYPDLGKWPRPRPWRREGDPKTTEKDGRTPKAVRGIRYSRAAQRLPAITRITHAPITGCMYYEWYVPVDEDHYIYLQMATYWFKNPIDRLWFYAKFYGYGRWAQFIRFNNQDADMVRDTTDYAKRHGFSWPSRLHRVDQINFDQREIVNRTARGVGTDWVDGKLKDAQEEPAAATREPVAATPSTW